MAKGQGAQGNKDNGANEQIGKGQRDTRAKILSGKWAQGKGTQV